MVVAKVWRAVCELERKLRDDPVEHFLGERQNFFLAVRHMPVYPKRRERFMCRDLFVRRDGMNLGVRVKRAQMREPLRILWHVADWQKEILPFPEEMFDR
ncbi:MAG: hypothetical protein ACFNON_03150, partial [Veillonella parvula]